MGEAKGRVCVQRVKQSAVRLSRAVQEFKVEPTSPDAASPNSILANVALLFDLSFASLSPVPTEYAAEGRTQSSDEPLDRERAGDTTSLQVSRRKKSRGGQGNLPRHLPLLRNL